MPALPAECPILVGFDLVDGIDKIIIGFSQTIWLKPNPHLFLCPPAKAGGNSKNFLYTARGTSKKRSDELERFFVNSSYLQRPTDYFMPSVRASSSGTSISMRRSAVEKVLPCASVIKESVPPPSRLSCKRKLSTPRFGNSKRSTAP